MLILVTYDVSTKTAEGERRLRRVAQVCQDFGQRVQKSVFECIVNAVELELLKFKLQHEMSQEEDSVRIYRLREPRGRYLQIMGRQPTYDLREPLVL